MPDDPRVALDGLDHLDRLGLVRTPEPPVRRRRRLLPLPVSRLAARHGITRRLVLLGGAPAAVWTAGMIALAWHVRF